MNKIYSSPTEIEITKVVSRDILNPGSVSYTTNPGKTEYIPTTICTQSSVGIGKSVSSYRTRYDPKISPSSVSIVSHGEYTSHIVDIHYKSDGKPFILELSCLSKSRQESIMKLLEGRKTIHFRTVLGFPVIDEIGYGFWSESPFGLLAIISAPVLAIACISTFFI